MVERPGEFPVEGGGPVLVRVEDEPATGGYGGGEVPRGWDDRAERVVLKARQSSARAVARVRPAVPAPVRRLRSLTESPQGIRVDSGLEPSAGVVAPVAGAGSAGDVTVLTAWRPGRAAAEQGTARAEPYRGDPGVYR